MKIEGINFTVFTTFLGDKWRLDKLSDEVAGKMWKALVNFFDTGVEPNFDDPVHECIFEEFKQTNIRNAMKNKEKNDRRKNKQPEVTVEPITTQPQQPQKLYDPYPGDGLY